MSNKMLDTEEKKRTATGLSQEADQRLRDSYDAYLDRDDFSYDVAKDPLYQQYKKQYTDLGKLAMEDTTGQAAALTGGYGNSYAQTVGQQTYNRYMQQLSAAVPELYNAAYNRYQAEGEALYNDIVLQEQRRQQALAEQENSRSTLVSLMAMGYSPTEAELTAAGLTAAQADSIRNYYTPKHSDTNAQSPDKVEDTVTYYDGLDYLRHIGLPSDGLMNMAQWVMEKQKYRSDPIDPSDPATEAAYSQYVKDYVEEMESKGKK